MAALGVERFYPRGKQCKLLSLALVVAVGVVVVVVGCGLRTGHARGYNHLVVWCRREQTCEAVKLREHLRIKYQCGGQPQHGSG